MFQPTDNDDHGPRCIHHTDCNGKTLVVLAFHMYCNKKAYCAYVFYRLEQVTLRHLSLFQHTKIYLSDKIGELDFQFQVLTLFRQPQILNCIRNNNLLCCQPYVFQLMGFRCSCIHLG